MAFRLIRDAGGTGRPPRAVTLNVQRLTIGSAPDQGLHLPVAGVDPRHAVITSSRDGQLLLSVASRRGVSVNTRRIRKASLWPGDRLQIGAAVVTVEQPLSAQVCVLRIEEPSGPPEAAAARGPHLTVGLSISFWSWALTLGVTTIFLLIPLAGMMAPALGKALRAGPLLPSDALWSPGPLAAAHQSIGADCTACHLVPFVPVRDQECGACHADVQHHVDIHSPDVRLFAGETCGACHREHKQPAALVESDPRLCTDCHAHLERLKARPDAADVTDFGSDHPDFRVSVLASDAAGWHVVRLDRRNPRTFIERSHLRFSHAQHLNPKGIKTPTGERVLVCQDCHKLDSSGRHMVPIRMTVQCVGCHSLRFDEHDPATTLPHGDLQAAIRTVQDHFSRQYLEHGTDLLAVRSAWRRPGAAPARPTGELAAAAWVDQQALKITRELMEKRVCVECHEVIHLPGRTGLDQWRIRPVRLTTDWMPFARFDHSAHRTQKCITCHDGAERSTHASDILMPTIARCRQCHGGVSDTTRVASTCLMCHQFHLPDRGRFLAASAALLARSR